MFISVIALTMAAAAQGDMPRGPATVMGPLGPHNDQVTLPTPDEIRRSEAFAIAISTEREPDGSFRMPDVELDAYHCTLINSKYAACAYSFHEKRVGEKVFGPWIAKKQVFAHLGGSWSMLNADKNCYSPDPKAYPQYCIPEK